MERRREREKATINKDFEKFNEMEEHEMIRLLQEQEEKMWLEKETKIEKAERRKRYWKEWRKVDKDDETDKDIPEQCELRMIHDSMPRLGKCELSDGNRLIVRNGGEIFIPRSAR